MGSSSVKRRLLHVATVLSAVLAVAIAVTWVHSKTSGARLTWNRLPSADPKLVKQFECISANGLVLVKGGLWDYSHAPVAAGERLEAPALGIEFQTRLWKFWFDTPRDYLGSTGFSRAGFGFAHFELDPFGTGWNLGFPHWFALLILLILPMMQITHFIRKSRRRALNCCAICGYDLRATPHQCPECGTTVVTPS